MRIAFISDIHGNSWALNSVLSDIKLKGISEIYDLGDSLYGPLDPNGTFNLLKEHKIKSIRGNQDRCIIENINTPSKHETLDFVINELSDESFVWLKELLVTRQIYNEFFLCHGMPDNDSEYLIEELNKEYVGIKDYSILDSLLSKITEKNVVCGHSHSARLVETPNKVIINPGVLDYLLMMMICHCITKWKIIALMHDIALLTLKIN